MRKNKCDEKFQRLRALDKESNSLASSQSDVEWVPVEDPQFIGWEISIVLSEGRSRSRDAEDLLTVMQILQMDRAWFVRSSWVPAMIKAAGKSYVSFIETYDRQMKRRYKGWDPANSETEYFAWERRASDMRYGWFRNYIPHVGGRAISTTTYDNLPGHLKRYFVKESKYWWRAETERDFHYKLNRYVFPMYELKLKYFRAYSTHRGIPKSDEISRYEEIEKVIMNENWWEIQDQRTSRARTFFHKYAHRVDRRVWRDVVQSVKNTNKYANIEAVEDDLYYKESKLKANDYVNSWW